jgi:hypothetical protein
MRAALPPIPSHLYDVALDNWALALGLHFRLADPGFLL